MALAGAGMAYIGITASEDGLAAAEGGGFEARLADRLRAIRPEAPVVILIHGYKFDPSARNRPANDPHRSLYAFGNAASRKVRSWPAGLGFGRDDAESGLCVGFGWPAAEPHLASILLRRRNGFAAVYERAAQYGRRLAELILHVRRLAPGRPVDLLAHSLGARVAITALPHLPEAPDRVILLGAAEFDGRVLEALAAHRGRRAPQVYNVTARANDFYDFVFETFAPRRDWSERAIGLGLREPLPCWLDLQLDRHDLTEWINAKGVRLTPPNARLCHWSFYTRAGAFDVYQSILRRRPGWDIPSLRATACRAAQEPRWSRLSLRAPGSAASRLPGGARFGNA